MVPTGYGGMLKYDWETFDDMWTICKTRACKEIVACISNLVRTKAKAVAHKSRKYVAFVLVFGSQLWWCRMLNGEPFLVHQHLPRNTSPSLVSPSALGQATAFFLFFCLLQVHTPCHNKTYSCSATK